ncbi:MAG TPA: polysaccharide biosynthesis tyrosine autokinase [Desulfobacterales bacterium]|nr:polysaccharide biosynthesis tyrosine autokinase [Desulfobacterales bacterium]
MEEKEIHLRDYWRVIQKRKHTVLTFLFITFTVVLIGTLTATPEYLASTKVLIQENQFNPLAKYTYYSQTDPDFVATQTQIIKSQRVAEKVVALLKLAQNYKTYFPPQPHRFTFFSDVASWFKARLKAIVKALTPAKQTASTNAVDDEKISEADILAQMISQNITVTPVKESKVISISYMSGNPVLARLIANTVAKAYKDEILEMKMATSNDTIKWMNEKAAQERAKLAESEKNLETYMRQKDIVTVQDKITVIPQKLTEFSVQLSKAEARRKELATVYKQLRQAGSPAAMASIPVIAQNRTIQALQAQIVIAEQHVSELSKKYGPKHPLMIKAVGERDGLIEKKAQECQRIVKSVKNEYELAGSNEQNLKDLLNKAKSDALGLNEKFIQYNVLKREEESNRYIYEALLAKLKEQNITDQNQSVNVWIIEKAKTPVIPAKPKKKRNILLGLVLGLFGGVGLAFFIEYLDNTVKSPDEAEERLGLSVLGLVERFDTGAGELLTELDPHSNVTESYKGIRTSLLLSSADRPPKAILVTSMLPGEGKTTTAANLAAVIAQSELKVLLIDADLRKGRLHKMFDFDNSKGLSTYLAGIDGSEVMVAGPEKNLKIIPSGPVPPNPSELLSSRKMKDLLSSAADKFDIVIFDSPPVMSVTDALILSKIVDGTTIVIKAGETTYEAVERELKSFRELDSRILGIVLNAVNRKKSDYYSYYGYYGRND